MVLTIPASIMQGTIIPDISRNNMQTGTIIDQNDPRINAAAATWHKRISLRIFRPGMNDNDNNTDTIRMSSVYSYWYFR